MKLIMVIALAFAAFAATPAHAAATPLEDCMARQFAASARTQASPEVLDRMRAVCYDIIADGQRLNTLNATARIYEEQIVQSRILLFVVVFITLSGIALAIVQLWASYKLALLGQGKLADGGEVAVEAGKVAVKSSVVGVVILAISLAFFAIFINGVYKLSPLVTPESEAGSSSTGTERQPPPPSGLPRIQR